jgi:hypothetical protein
LTQCTKERERIIEANWLCTFCLLHDRSRACGAKERQVSPACNAPGCKGRHIRKLHEFLKDMYGEENRVHLVQGNGGWEEPEGAWAMDKTEEEEAMIVNTILQVESSWQETGDSWLELSGGEAGGVFCVGACHGENGQVSGAEVGQPRETSYLPKEEGAIEAGWVTPDPRELQFGEGEEEYLIDLLMGGSAACEGRVEPPRMLAATGAADHSAGEGEAVGQKAQPQGENRENRPATGGGPKKAAVGRKEASDEKASRGENRPCAETEVEEAGAQGEQGLKGWAPWWPSGREGGGLPHSPQGPDSETKNNTGVGRARPRERECK